MDITALLGYFAAAVLSLYFLRRAYHNPQLDSIPTVGSSGIFSSYYVAYRYLFRAPETVAEGSRQYRGRVFRIPRLLRGWDFIATGPALIDELSAAPESVLSLTEGAQNTLQVDITVGPNILKNQYPNEVVRTSLTRNLDKCFPDICDEMSCAFEEVLSLNGTEWKLLPLSPAIMSVVARTTNRLFVGLPICRNPEYLKLVLQYAVDVVIRSQIINLFPSFLRPIVGPYISTRKQSLRKALRLLGPLVKYRLEQETIHGPNWAEKPNDFLSWLLEAAEGEERTVPALVLRILGQNMNAIHTTSMVLTHALFDLTAHPRYITPMREEAERVVGEEGLTRAALNRMHKIDSFLRETQRVHDNGPATFVRKVMDPNGFLFSDGTHLPYGSIITTASRAEHFDPANYKDPDTFDGFRFSRMREEAALGNDIFQHHMITTSVSHLAFGHKRHACPGRFFAATELKSMLAHIVMNYDIRAEMEGVRPADDVFGLITAPNRKAKIWFRKRE